MKPDYFTYTLKPSCKRRTLAVTVDRNANVIVYVPAGLSEEKVQAFLEDHRAWILRHRSERLAKIAASPEETPERIAFLRREARRILPDKVRYYSSLMGLYPTGLTVTAARTRYGSCSAKNRISFSCFLMEKPEAAIDYVVVHELAHIRHKNHGSAFYACIARYLPDYKARIALLKK